MNKRLIIVILMATLLPVFRPGSASAAEVPPRYPFRVVVTLTVLKDFVEQIGGEKVRVTGLLSGFEDQHTYTSSPADILAVRDAALLVKIGLGFDVWTDALAANAQNPNLAVVETSRGVPLMGTDPHEPDTPLDGERKHASGNPHIWLDPENAKVMIRHITDALVELDPSGEGFYRIRQEAYFTKLDDLTRRMADKVSILKNRSIITHHDAWPYFARRFGFDIRDHIITQAGGEPSAKHLIKLIRIIRDEKIRAIVSEPQLSPRFPQILAEETQARVVLLSPIPGVIQGADHYYSMIEYNVNVLADALKE
jgi:ABC-type Zn uptake system ZnuABC Zn-binding protein ZnuA